MENIFYLNKNLQIETYKSDAVAFAYYFKDKDHNSLYQLGNNRFKKIVEITFFDPIDHFANLIKSNKLQKNWCQKHYPQYHSFLPSETICKLINAKTNKNFDNCWTRTSDNDGYPMCRNYPVMIKDGRFYLGDTFGIVKNVYVSLVLTKEEFLKINSNAKLVD